VQFELCYEIQILTEIKTTEKSVQIYYSLDFYEYMREPHGWCNATALTCHTEDLGFETNQIHYGFFHLYNRFIVGNMRGPTVIWIPLKV